MVGTKKNLLSLENEYGSIGKYGFGTLVHLKPNRIELRGSQSMPLNALGAQKHGAHENGHLTYDF